MDQTQLQKKISEYYAKLPQKMQEVFASREWLTRLSGISSRYSLTEAQIQTLGTETALVMLGIIHPDEYEQTLLTELAVPRPIGIKIIEDINLEVLRSWKEILTETYKKNNRETTENLYGNGKTLDERWRTLPPQTQQAIVSSDYQNTLLEIGKDNNLNIEEMGKLDTATMQMMLGNTKAENYSSELIKSLGIAQEKGEKIAKEVNEKILKNIRSTLMAQTPPKAEKAPLGEPKVPLPPYKNKPPEYAELSTAPFNIPTGSSNGVLKTAGIELIDNDRDLAPKNLKQITEQTMEKDGQTLMKSGVNILEDYDTVDTTPNSSRSQVLSGIENPPDISTDIMSAKLSGPVVNNLGRNDVMQSETPLPSGDKYREQI